MFDKKYGYDIFSEMFDFSSNDILRKWNIEEYLFIVDMWRNGRIYFYDLLVFYEI